MANIRALATAGLLVTFASGASTAVLTQEIPVEVKSCKAISDDKERLKCFDSLFGRPLKPQTNLEEKQMKEPAEEKQANWSIDESKSPTDGSPQVVAAESRRRRRVNSQVQRTDHRSCIFDVVLLSRLQIC